MIVRVAPTCNSPLKTTGVKAYQRPVQFGTQTQNEPLKTKVIWVSITVSHSSSVSVCIRPESSDLCFSSVVSSQNDVSNVLRWDRWNRRTYSLLFLFSSNPLTQNHLTPVDQAFIKPINPNTGHWFCYAARVYLRPHVIQSRRFKVNPEGPYHADLTGIPTWVIEWGHFNHTENEAS